MSYLEEVIITATTANSWIYPKVKNWAENINDLINDIVDCYETGAAIAHVHLPRGHEVEVVNMIRERCDVIIQAGMSSESIPKRSGDFEAKPEMMSVILNHHAEHFSKIIVDVLHPIKELEDYCIKLRKAKIQPEWEVWHTGSYWNLRYLIEKGLLDWSKPHILTLFFNWPGGTWSPPTNDEYMHRRRYMPSECVHTVSVMGEAQMKLLKFVLTHNGNIRVGTEDYPFIKKGKPARNNAEIVKQYVDISKKLGRDVADPSEARKILNL
ncbi:MAG: 3-keto-5-aminohexanoate cleavage protein [Candidatus Thorarchaeota archaeon]